MFFHFPGPDKLKNGDNSKSPKNKLLGFAMQQEQGLVNTGPNIEDEQGVAAKQPQKPPKIPRFVDTGPSTEDEQEPAVKQPQEGPIDTGLEDEDPQETSLGQVKKESAKPAKKLSAAAAPLQHSASASSHPT